MPLSKKILSTSNFDLFRFLAPLKRSSTYIINSIYDQWKSFWKSYPKIFSDKSWVRWSPPQDILNQLWEWEPLINVHLLANHITSIFSFIPNPSAGLLIIFIRIISFILAILKYLYSQKISIALEKEVINLTFICSSKKNTLFYSTNLNRNAKQYDFGSYLGIFFPLFFICDTL